MSSIELAAEAIAMHNVKLRCFLLRLIDPDDLGHSVSDEVRKIALKLLNRERHNNE